MALLRVAGGLTEGSRLALLKMALLRVGGWPYWLKGDGLPYNPRFSIPSVSLLPSPTLLSLSLTGRGADGFP